MFGSREKIRPFMGGVVPGGSTEARRTRMSAGQPSRDQMNKPITRTTTITAPPHALSAQISRIRVHQRPIVRPHCPRINADAADLHGAAEPQLN